MSEIEEQQVEYSWDITYNVVMGETYATFMENQRQKKIVDKNQNRKVMSLPQSQ